MPECPPHLDALAREEWNRQAPFLLKARILTESDRAALAIYCSAWSRMIAAEEHIQRDGLFTLASGGILCTHPAVKISERAAMLVHRFAVELGLTPSSRARLQVPDLNQGDLFEKYLDGDLETETVNGERVQ